MRDLRSMPWYRGATSPATVMPGRARQLCAEQRGGRSIRYRLAGFLLLLAAGALNSGGVEAAFATPSPIGVNMNSALIRWELNAFGAYGQYDVAADILYTGERNTWTLASPAGNPLPAGNYALTAWLVLDDHYGDNPFGNTPTSDYSISLDVDGVIKIAAIPGLQRSPRGVHQISNWTPVSVSVTLSKPALSFTVSISNNSTAHPLDWVAIDRFELSLSPVVLVDAVPDLLYGPQITTKLTAPQANPGEPYLADLTKGRLVQGVSTDGVAQVVMRIPAASVGDQIGVGIVADPTCGASDADDYGLLYDPASPPGNVFGNTTSASIITLTAVSTPQGPIAFAAYRAPVDFVRSDCPSNTDADKGAAQRTVSIAFSSSQSGQLLPDLPITLVRPPVILVHGLGSDSTNLVNLTAMEVDARFFVNRLNYGQSVTILSSDPPIVSVAKWPKKGSSLGLSYGADVVLSKAPDIVAMFAQGANRLSIPVAAVGIDAVGHSLGATVLRTLPLRPNYFTSNTYARGYLHKVISIGGPHLGTPFAGAILSPANKCSRDILERFGGFYVFGPCQTCVTATATQLSTDYKGSGGVGDMLGRGDGTDLSAALTNLLRRSSVPLPIAYLSGELSDTQIDQITTRAPPLCFTVPVTKTTKCTGPLPTNLVQTLTSYCSQDAFAAYFSSSAAFRAFLTPVSDGIVPLNSQRNGLKGYPIPPLPGVSHGIATAILYTPISNAINRSPLPTELSSPISDDVIMLLNTSITDSTRFVQ